MVRSLEMLEELVLIVLYTEAHPPPRSEIAHEACLLPESNHPVVNNPGHERSLTQIKFNREGDLLFSCSKDHVINVWFTHNGERLGTYDGHNGTVWSIDVDCAYAASSFLIFGAHYSLTLVLSSPVTYVPPFDG